MLGNFEDNKTAVCNSTVERFEISNVRVDCEMNKSRRHGVDVWPGSLPSSHSPLLRHSIEAGGGFRHVGSHNIHTHRFDSYVKILQ